MVVEGGGVGGCVVGVVEVFYGGGGGGSGDSDGDGCGGSCSECIVEFDVGDGTGVYGAGGRAGGGGRRRSGSSSGR